ncbi:MAG TPA: alpha/beta hydrolase [Caulobacteraceae bacterium]|nr:alpha/beta hydrolase [Caulobacteraceae bacterium]
MPGLVYSHPEGYRELTVDLYLPPQKSARPATGYPLVVYIHGGAWLAGNRRLNRPFVDFPGVLALLAARGYAVASVEYRLSGEARFPAQIQDVKGAISWLRSRSTNYGIDPARVMTWGVSAGGYLAGLAAVSCGVTAFEPPATPASEVTAPAPKTSECLKGAVSWYGLFDFATMAAQARNGSAISRDDAGAPEWRLLGCFATGCTAGQIAAASPVTYVDRHTPPMLLIAGDQDKLIPFQQTLDMADRLKAAGVSHRLVVVRGADHSLIGQTLDQTREANLSALDQTFRFMDEIFHGKP